MTRPLSHTSSTWCFEFIEFSIAELLRMVEQHLRQVMPLYALAWNKLAVSPARCNQMHARSSLALAPPIGLLTSCDVHSHHSVGNSTLITRAVRVSFPRAVFFLFCRTMNSFVTIQLTPTGDPFRLFVEELHLSTLARIVTRFS